MQKIFIVKIPSTILKKLNQRKTENSFRELPHKSFPIDFWSNDYLGFAGSNQLEKISTEILKNHPQPQRNGATGSRLISGNFPLYAQTETLIAQFHQSNSALIFNSGYDANIGIFSSIPQKGDLILYDQYIHASIRDGIALSNAHSLKFKHNDLNDLERILKKFYNSFKHIYVATESVFSMHGDSPDLISMVNLSEKYNAFFIVDEAHSFGIFGKKGEGLVQSLGLEQRIFIRLITFGKALGCHGAVVLSDKNTTDFLVNFARSFIYTTGLSPHAISCVSAGYKLLQTENHQQKLQENISYFRKKIQQQSFSENFLQSVSPIQALIVRTNEKAQQIATILQKNGFGVKAILSPTIPKNQERLRICLHSFNTKSEIDALFEIFSNQF